MTAIILLFSIIISQFSTMPISFAADSVVGTVENIEVNTVEELEGKVKKATKDVNITLASDFVFGDIELEMPGVSIIINGEGKTWDSGSTTITGSGTGSITISDLKYDGTNIENKGNIDKKIININNENGKVILENVEITNSTKGAMDIKTGKDATTVLNSVYIHDNTAENTASAINLGENSNLDINNSTIENNTGTGTGSGEATGAISSTKYEETLNINNTVFRNNINNSTNSGTLGGGGGAMAFHYFYGNINVTESIFDGNSTNGESGDIKDSYDGGAIYIFDGRENAKVDIKNSTFTENIAYDDGGAIMFRGTGNPGLITSITNSTFFKNKAYGLGDMDYAGGAIQYFKNGGSAKMVNNILSSTFVGNESGNENSEIEQRGGAIGLSGAGIFAMGAVTRNNSLFLDNKVYGADGNINKASNYKDISNYTTVQAGQGKANVINVQKGATLEYTNKDILGVKEPKLAVNSTDIVAGFVPEPVKTILIRPGGIADNGYVGAVDLPEKDQRGFYRYKDYGAVEIQNIEYDANGGEFVLKELEDKDYDGKYYYQKDKVDNTENNEMEGKITKYYTIGKINETDNIKNGNSELQIKKEATEEDKKVIFLGWSANKEAIKPDKEYIAGKEISYTNENITLYAVWAEILEVIYKDGADGAVFMDTSFMVKAGEKAPSFFYINDEGNKISEPTREGYKFVEWQINGGEYDFNTPVTENIELIAIWEELYKVTYDGNGNTSGGVPIDEMLYEKDTEIILKDKGNLTKEGYKFIGWSLTKEGEIIERLNITEDITLYAIWEEDTYKVKFNADGGKFEDNTTEIKEETVSNGEKVLSKTVTKEGYKFVEWQLGENKYDFNTPVTESIELKAKWEEIIIPEYTVSFNTDGGTEIESQTVKENELATLPTEPTKEDYTFVGWQLNGEEYDFNTPVTEDIELKAIWEEIESVTPPKEKYKLIYDGNENTAGEVPTDDTLYEKDTEIILKDKGNLTKEGYKFRGWSLTKDGEIIEKLNITEDTILYAIWEKIDSVDPVDPGQPIEPSLPIDPEEPSNPSKPLDPKPIEPEKPVQPELNKEDHYGYMIGYPEGLFKPNTDITRGEVSTIFFRMLEDSSRENYFSKINNYSDVKNTDWYNNAVSTMSNAKLIFGYNDGTFRPNENMTRAEMIVLITRFFNEEGEGSHKFTDIKNHWAEKEISKIVEKGWIKGYEDGTFKPDQPITRAETVKLINLILERTPDKNNLLDGMIEFKDNKDKTKWYYADIQEATNSHEFTRENNKSKEVWTKLLPARDWSELDKRK